MSYKFTNWHQHSGYSWLDGASLPIDIVRRCKELGMEYVCLSDHGNVAGHIDMYDAAKSEGLIPVLGTELYMKDDKYDNGKPKGYHVCLWALNETGLHNLWAISSNTYYSTGDGHRIPNASWEHFDGLGEGVACTSACLASAIAKAAEDDDEEMALYFAQRYASIFDEFAIELHTNSMPEQRVVNLWLYKFAKKHGYRVVYSVDAHYAMESDADFHDMWLGCQTKAFYDEKHWTMAHEYYIQGESEVRDRLAYLGQDAVDDCFRGVDELLSKVEPFELDGSHKVPKYPLPDGWSDSSEYMKYLVAKGLFEKVGGCKTALEDGGQIRVFGNPKTDLTPYLKQLGEEELPIITENGLSDYFLITADYVTWAKERMLVGPGRGSCVGSLVCYLLGITSIDPMGKGLYFSRFLNEGRLGSLPDIDSDFQDESKHLVHEYLIDNYGVDKVTAVGVTTFFGMKLALKEVCRYYRIPIADANKITSIFDDLEDMAGDGDWRDAMPLLKDEDRLFVEGYESQFPDLFARAEKMVGLPRQAGKHAAGYVISPEPLAKLLPIRKSSGDEVISQFDKVAVERMGFLKADVLGLRNLTTLQMAADDVFARTGERIDYYSLTDDPFDMDVWSLFDNGRTLGVFQMEGAGITNVAMRLKPRSVSDLSTIVALYRPGVIGAGMLDKYIARASGDEDVEYVTPMLEPILEDTLGVIVFQEQAMSIFSSLAGFTPTESDHIRAAIGKKKLEKIKAEKPKFIDGCAERGVAREHAEEIFRQIEASGSYSFNRCLAGDTLVRRSASSAMDSAYPTADIPISVIYERWNSKTSVGEKYRDPKRGLKIQAFDQDGRSRYYRVKGVYMNGVKPVYRVMLEDGKSVKATANHRLLSARGYVEVGGLSVGDELVVCDFEYEPCSNNYNFSGKKQEQKGKTYGTGNGFPKGDENPGYIDGSYSMFSEERLSRKGDPCDACGAVSDRMELHHIDGDRSNGEKGNLEWLCTSCHKKRHYDMGRRRRGEKGYPTSLSRVVSVEYVGEEMTYDLEMDTEEHNFFANGICSHNSHSLAYATIAFWTAYMKAHHATEYYAACMSTVNMDKAPKFIKEARRMGVMTVPPTVTSPSLGYKVIDDGTISFGLTGVKGVGIKAAESIIANAPYTTFEDFVDRSGVNSAVIKTLIKCGFFRDMYKNSRDLLMRYEGGEFRASLFGDSLSEDNRFSTDYEHAPYPDDRVVEIETELLGMPLTIDPFERYRELLGSMYEQTTTAEAMSVAGYGTMHAFLVRIDRVKTHMTKKGEQMAFLDMENDHGEPVEAVCFPNVFSLAKHILREGRYAMVEVAKNSWSGRDSYQVTRVKKLEC